MVTLVYITITILGIINTEVLQASESGYCATVGSNSDVGIFVLQVTFTESGFTLISCLCINICCTHPYS